MIYYAVRQKSTGEYSIGTDCVHGGLDYAQIFRSKGQATARINRLAKAIEYSVVDGVHTRKLKFDKDDLEIVRFELVEIKEDL